MVSRYNFAMPGKSASRQAIAEMREICARAKAYCHGIDAVELTQHARLISIAVQAFGDEPDAAFFVESLPPSVRIPRPDLVIAHPDIGVLVIENKGVPLADIHDVRADELSIERDGQPNWERPFMQADKVMYRLKGVLQKRVSVKSISFNRMAALPKVAESDFQKRFGATWKFATIFSEALEHPRDFRIYVTGFVDYQAPRLFAGTRITRQAVDELRSIFAGTCALSPPRAGSARRKKTDRQSDSQPTFATINAPTAHPLPTVVTEAQPPTKTIGDYFRALDLLPRKHTAQQQELLRIDPRTGHRLFRGVAGSGKSVILAGMVARTYRRILSESDRDPKMLVCCFNRTLVHFLKDKIDTELARICWQAHDDKSVRVTHFDRLLIDLTTREKRLRNPFDINHRTQRAQAICKAFDDLPTADQSKLMFDAIFIDEAQDLEPAEFELLRRLATPDAAGNQSLTIFYDNAQNIYGRLTPTWEHLGINIVGRTTYLDECLRNTQQIVELAMNVLIGSCAPAGVRAQTRQFADLANLKSRNLVDEFENRVAVKFCKRQGEAPVVRLFENRRAESRWIIHEMERLIVKESVNPADILILYRSHKDFVAHLPFQLGALAGQHDFGTRLVDAEHNEAKDSALIQPNILTVSTIASAKGYDAPIVFVVGVDRIDADSRGRAQFYVAATRARHLLYITGLDAGQNRLGAEAKSCLDLQSTTHQPTTAS